MLKKNIIFYIGALVAFITLLSSITITISAKEDISKFNDYTFVGIKQKDDVYKVSVLVKIKTKEDIYNYKSISRKNFNNLTNNSNTDFLATVTLNKPLSIEEFKELANNYNLKINDFKIRAYENDGTRVTIGGVPSNEELVSKEVLNSFLGNNTFGGIFAFTCKVNNKNFDCLKNIYNNESIYLVNIDSAFIKDEVQSIYNKNIKGYIVIPDIYWHIEEFHLLK